MEINYLETAGWMPAIRGMRNSFASWKKSDSNPLYYYVDPDSDASKIKFRIGPNDLKLMQRLYKAGGSERKFMRVIQIWCDISAPLTWWKQFDTYKVGTTGLSTSTMHSITDKPFSVFNFDTDPDDEHLLSTIDYLNKLRDSYLYDEYFDTNTKKRIWRGIIDNLPESYIQLRTVNMNYEVVAHMINDRKSHKLTEWHYFCEYMSNNLPYLKEIINV